MGLTDSCQDRRAATVVWLLQHADVFSTFGFRIDQAKALLIVGQSATRMKANRLSGLQTAGRR